MNKEHLLLVGRIIGVHGIKGEVKIFPYGDCDKKSWKILYLCKQGHRVTCDVAYNRPHKGIILALLTGCDDRESAAALVGYDVFVDKAVLPLLPEGEYYNFQIEGLEVVTDEGEIIGRITDILSTDGNDVYVANGPRGEVLIPAIKDVVLKVDVKNGKMIIRLLEGLLGGRSEGDMDGLEENEV